MWIQRQRLCLRQASIRKRFDLSSETFCNRGRHSSSWGKLWNFLAVNFCSWLLALQFCLPDRVFAGAETYPTRPITIVVPFPAGGPTDTLARILADRMTAALGQSVVIEDVAGASGRIGLERVARALPDGYTLSIGHWGTHVVIGATMKLPFDVLNDFAPVALLAN